MIWSTFVRHTCPGKVIGICYDYDPTHTNYILEWVELQNKVYTNGTRIFLAYIDPCPTIFYQPCDVVINKPLRQKTRGFLSLVHPIFDITTW